MKQLNILLDMDGVLADFFTSAVSKLNRETGLNFTVESYAKTGKYEMEEVYGITTKQLWDIVDRDQFWYDLSPMPHAAELMNSIRVAGFPIYISSTPTHNPNCVQQKIDWLKKHFGLDAHDCMFGKHKWLMAKPGALLIDDLPSNCKAFSDAGGQAALVPSNWNTPNLTFEEIWSKIAPNL